MPLENLFFGWLHTNDGATAGCQCFVQGHFARERQGPGVELPTFWFVNNCSNAEPHSHPVYSNTSNCLGQ